MTKEQYKAYLTRKGYTFKNDTAYLKTSYGLMIEKIEEDVSGDGSFELAVKHNPLNPLFGVSQSHCGHEYRWIFDEREIERQLNWIPQCNTCEDILWPMGGSNSSATFFETLPDMDAVEAFLVTPGEPDLDDPELVDIGEYLATAETGDGSITQECIDYLEIPLEKLAIQDDCYGRKEEILKRCADLKEIGFSDFDVDNPFYGENKGMCYSEFCDMYEKAIAEYENEKE